MRRTSVIAIAIVVGVLLVASACSGDDDDGAATSTTLRTTSTSSTTTVTAPTSTAASVSTSAPPSACPPLDGATTDRTESAPASASGLLTDVQLTTGDCTDSVAFTFDVAAADAPGYRVEYVPGPIAQDGSGEPVTVAGGAYLSVRFEPAYGYDFETGTETYAGPGRVTSPGSFFVQEVVETGDFEAVLNWVVGVDQQRPYTVTTTGSSTTRTVTIELR